MSWWRKMASEVAAAKIRDEMFEDLSTCVALHFPSMATVHYSLYPIVYCGEARRLDGPRWLVRFLPMKDGKSPETRDPTWEEADGSLSSRIEAAYQRYLLLPSGAGANTEPRWFFEWARQTLQALRKEPCAMCGLDGE